MKNKTPKGRTGTAQLAITYGGRRFSLSPELSLRVSKVAREWHTTVEKAVVRILGRETRTPKKPFFCFLGAST